MGYPLILPINGFADKPVCIPREEGIGKKVERERGGMAYAPSLFFNSYDDWTDGNVNQYPLNIILEVIFITFNS